MVRGICGELCHEEKSAIVHLCFSFRYLARGTEIGSEVSDARHVAGVIVANFNYICGFVCVRPGSLWRALMASARSDCGGGGGEVVSLLSFFFNDFPVGLT